MRSTAANLAPLLGRTLVAGAHPDDEAIGCGALLQRMREPHVAFLTDGAPRDSFFWHAHGSREDYAELRRREARAALRDLGIDKAHFLADIVDQELFQQLSRAQDWLGELIARLRPEALLVPAFEGGHPDHDACNLLGAVAARRLRLPVWEMPLYHRSVAGVSVCQQFLSPNGHEVALQPLAEEREKKRRMVAHYASQGALLQQFPAPIEYFRPLPAYDYSRPPHSGVLNYEAWQWRMTGSEVAAAFTAHLEVEGRGMDDRARATRTLS